MRRHSLVGPFVLIVIGAIFLYNNINPNLNLFSLFAQYWPFLLIGLGVLRLIEVLSYSARSKPLPGGGGGEILLVVLLCIFGTIFFQVHKHGPQIHMGRRTMDL